MATQRYYIRYYKPNTNEKIEMDVVKDFYDTNLGNKEDWLEDYIYSITDKHGAIEIKEVSQDIALQDPEILTIHE